MQFQTRSEAVAFMRSEESGVPLLRGRLRVLQDTATRWDPKTGEPYSVVVWAVVIR